MDPSINPIDMAESSNSILRPHSSGKMSEKQKGKQRATISSVSQVQLDESRLDHEIALLVSEYLHSRPNAQFASAFDEEVLGIGREKDRDEDVEEVERAILDGEFGSLEGLLARPGLLKPQSQKAFLYLCHRQQFLEYIENRESQKAFNLLQKRLKPLEHYQPVPYDFYNLCYLTSAGTVHDAPGMKDWGGAGPERESLVQLWRELTDGVSGTEAAEERAKVPPGRLVQLLKQAAAWQVATARRTGPQPWTVSSLLQDYSVRALPNSLRRLVTGHQANVKCVEFVSEGLAVSGSSDSTLRVFDTETGMLRRSLLGHTSRVWDISVSRTSNIASGSGDGTVRVWHADSEQVDVLNGQGGDVYGVRWKPGRDDELITASYDSIIRSWDLVTMKQIRTFSGHTQSALCVAYDGSSSRLIASGSKDKSVKVWDASGGVCVMSLDGSLGEITSVEFDQSGRYLLAACKDNSNRLWDLRMQKNIYRYIGHQNTSKNLIRCSFGGGDGDSSHIISGSEDGLVYIWDREPSSTNDRCGTGKTKSLPQSAQAGATTATSEIRSPLALGPPAAGASLALSSSYPSTLNGQRSSAYMAKSPTITARSSPAYYPAKGAPLRIPTTASNGGHAGGVGCINVNPVKTLQGHGKGAVFDAKWNAGGDVITAGEDGAVGIWTTEEGS